MECRLQELRNKEVINARDGARLGCVGDILVDTITAKVCAIIICGRPKCLGFLGREPDIIIRWSEIQIIGEDTILVCCNAKPNMRKKSFLTGLFGE